jgi:hypothetical protein
MDELRNAIALLFRRKGSNEMTEREFVLSASMDFRWFPPRDAQKLLELAVNRNVVSSDAGVLRPAFDVASTEVPRDFVATSKILDAASPPIEEAFLRIVDALAAATHTDRRSVIASINGIQERMDVDVEVAALVAAYRVGVDVRPYLSSVAGKFRAP